MGLLKNRKKASGACQVAAADAWEAKQWLPPQSPPQPSHKGAAGSMIPAWGMLSSSSWAGAQAIIRGGWSPWEDGCTITAATHPKFLRHSAPAGERAMEIEAVNENEFLFLCPNAQGSDAPWAARDVSVQNRRGHGGGSATQCTKDRCLSQNQPQQLRRRGPDTRGHEVISECETQVGPVILETGEIWPRPCLRDGRDQQEEHEEKQDEMSAPA